ncbi:MAG TPA: PAS domain S-box protein [Spirochaetota bacterium]|nr:PAS domain S-box protein [Spirochaetota bacterium]HPI90139.1 PAS domain S-box protein [Spirochaetota bacterium]HPR49145.1 PAS domain S-box protein [Spirochaetota bacterium]
MLESLFKTFNSTTAPVLILNSRAEITWMNNAFNQGFGFCVSDTDGNSRLPFLTPEHEATFKSLALRALQGKPPEPFIMPLLSAKGPMQDISWNTMLLDDQENPGKTAVALFGIETDSAEKKFTEIFMMAPDGISITRMRDGLILDTNIGFRDITKWEREEVIGRTSLDVNFWADPADREYLVKELKAGREARRREFRFCRKDGTKGTGIYSARKITISGEPCILFVMQDITINKEMEKQLEENRDRLHRISINLPGALFQFYATKNGDYGMNYVSERIREFFGIEPEMITHYPGMLTYVHEEDRERFTESVRQAVEACTPWNFEGRFIKPSGEVVWFNGISSPKKVENGVIFDGILINVTERNLAEERLKRLADLHQTVLDTILTAVMYIKDRKIQWVNNTCLKMFGYTGDELIGKETSVFYYRYDDYVEVGKEAYTHLARRESYFREVEGKKKDGAPFWCNLAGRAVNPDDPEEGSIWTAQDITDRKNAELALQKSEERFSKAFRSTPVPISITETETGRILDVNEQGVKISGFSYDELIGHTSSEMGIIYDWNLRGELITESLRNGAIKEIPIKLINKTGETRDILWSAEPINLDDREVMLSILFDVTERNQAEEFIRNSLNEKEVLLKELYHRAKNNMQVICSLLELKSDRAQEPGVHEIFTDIRTKIQTMALVHQKLYESQDLVNINLNDFAQSLSELIMNGHAIPPGKVTVEQSVDDLPISIDTAMPLGMVLNELISNSIKHAFPGDRKGKIKITIHRTGNDLRLEYRDNGKGLTGDFDPAASPTLGMHIIQNIVEKQLGGTINFINKNGLLCIINIKTDLYGNRV